MPKNRTLNHYRQNKEFGYSNPRSKSSRNSAEDTIQKIRDLRGQYPNDQEFGKAVAWLLRTIK